VFLSHFSRQCAVAPHVTVPHLSPFCVQSSSSALLVPALVLQEPSVHANLHFELVPHTQLPPF